MAGVSQVVVLEVALLEIERVGLEALEELMVLAVSLHLRNSLLDLQIGLGFSLLELSNSL